MSDVQYDPLETRILWLTAAHDTMRRAMNRYLAYQTGIALMNDIDRSLEQLGMSQAGRERKWFESARLAKGQAPSLYFTRSALRLLFAEAEAAREMAHEHRVAEAQRNLRAWAEKQRAEGGRAA